MKVTGKTLVALRSINKDDLRRTRTVLTVSNALSVSILSRRPQYQPLSLKRLQYLIDLGRIDTSQPIDLTQLVNARGVTIQPLKRDYGVQLVDEVNAMFLKHICLCILSWAILPSSVCH